MVCRSDVRYAERQCNLEGLICMSFREVGDLTTVAKVYRRSPTSFSAPSCMTFPCGLHACKGVALLQYENRPSVAIHVRTRGCSCLFGCLRLLLVRVYLPLAFWLSCVSIRCRLLLLPVKIRSLLAPVERAIHLMCAPWPVCYYTRSRTEIHIVVVEL